MTTSKYTVGALGALVLTLVLAACGGSGGGSATPAAPPAATELTLSATATDTIASGAPLTLTSSINGAGTVGWQLAAGNPGTLSAATGASVSYTPPATLAANTPVTVTATVGGISKTLALMVYRAPGAAGLSVVAGRLNSDLLDVPADGPGASARFSQSLTVAGDVAGNLYVAGTCRLSQTRLMGMSLRKIGTDGVVSTLASCVDNTWFGKPDTAKNLDQIYVPQGIAVDHAGNIYTANAFGATRAVYKITPQGVLTMLAGSATDSAALTDGNAATARFLSPEIVGIDSSDNLYALDKNGTVVRKITPAGDVSTVRALPASLKIDLNGNIYRTDAATGAVIRTTPAGVDSTIANVNTLPGVLPGMTPAPYGLVRTGPATYALVVSNGYTFPNEAIVKLVVAH